MNKNNLEDGLKWTVCDKTRIVSFSTSGQLASISRICQAASYEGERWVQV